MGKLTKEQLDEIWEANGLSHRIGRFRNWLIDRGMNTFVSKVKLQEHFYHVLYDFFVIGVKETEDGQQAVPASSASYERNTEGEGR